MLKPILDLKDRLRIQSYQVSEERDTVTFNTEIFSSDITEALGMTLRAKVVLYKDKSTLYVQSIVILNEPDINEFLQTYLVDTKISFIQLFNVIDENIGLYHEEETENSSKTLCEVIQSMSTKATLVNCNDHLVDMIQAGINYTFIIEDEVLVAVVISDPVLEAQIQVMLKNSLVNINTTYSLIEDILDKKPLVAEDKYIEQKLIITERMKLYLNTTPTIMVLEGPIFEITFTLGEFTLKGTYDMATNVISRIYYVIPNINETLLIRNFSLPIDAANKESLAHLSNNPRAVLSVFNPMAFDRYEKLSQQQK
ncbi:hypothetical protein FACS1894176_07030 [Bacteroidia bacterium]|nr:hypothetical protein FACS1894176_07030 [Bacteroidia bacterium]